MIVFFLDAFESRRSYKSGPQHLSVVSLTFFASLYAAQSFELGFMVSLRCGFNVFCSVSTDRKFFSTLLINEEAGAGARR